VPHESSAWTLIAAQESGEIIVGVRLLAMLTSLTVPYEYGLQTQLSIDECRQRLEQHLRIDNAWLVFDLDVEAVRGWVTLWGFSIRRTVRIGAMEARGSFKSAAGGTAIRVQMGAMPGIPILLGFVAIFAIGLGVMASLAMHSPLGLAAAAPAGAALLYPRAWRDPNEAQRLLRFLQETLQAEVVSATSQHPGRQEANAPSD
jgi:hypothetical protein